MMPNDYAVRGFVSRGPVRAAASSTGHSLIELVFVVVIFMILMAISVPIAQSTYKGFHLTAASTQISGAIQSARYQAIQTGCNYTITFTTTATTYQLAAQVPSGTPPTCATSYSNVGQAQYWSTSNDVSIQSGATTLTVTMQPNGIVTATGGTTCTAGVGCLTLTNSKSTNTVVVSGVGNVTVTTP